MDVFDNEDNTMTIEGMYSSGKKTIGALIKVESLVSGKVLFKQRLPETSEITIAIPKEPYQIVLDGGPGHIMIKKGIIPKEGFSKVIKRTIDTKNSLTIAQNAQWGNTSIFLFTLCLILLVLAIYFSNKNTQKILNLIQNKK
jgi:hypothetical protein